MKSPVAETPVSATERLDRLERLKGAPRHLSGYLSIVRRLLARGDVARADRLLDGLMYALENRK